MEFKSIIINNVGKQMNLRLYNYQSMDELRWTYGLYWKLLKKFKGDDQGGRSSSVTNVE